LIPSSRVDSSQRSVSRSSSSDASSKLRSAGQLAQRLLHTLGQRVELALADSVGCFVYVLHGGSPRLEWTDSHSPRCQRQRTRRENRHLKFYELRDNLADGHGLGLSGDVYALTLT
jgi:hypothetical protein